MSFWKSLFGGHPGKSDERRLVSGGHGSSYADAINVHASNSTEGLAIEYAVIEGAFGKRDADWMLESQLLQGRDGRHFDVLTLALKDGNKQTLYFDITDFYGQF